MLLKDIETNFPFISVASYGGVEYVGIIVNQDQHQTTMYVYTSLHTNREKKKFLELLLTGQKPITLLTRQGIASWLTFGARLMMTLVSTQ